MKKLKKNKDKDSKKKMKKKDKKTKAGKSASFKEIVNAILRRFKKDPANGGFREGTQQWAYYQALTGKFKFNRSIRSKPFHPDDLTKAVKVLTKELKIKVNLDITPKMLWIFQQMGVVRRIGWGKYEVSAGKAKKAS